MASVRGEGLAHEGESLQRHGQGGEVQVLALVLVLAVVEHGQLGRLVEGQQVSRPSRDIEQRAGFRFDDRVALRGHRRHRVLLRSAWRRLCRRRGRRR